MHPLRHYFRPCEVNKSANLSTRHEVVNGESYAKHCVGLGMNVIPRVTWTPYQDIPLLPSSPGSAYDSSSPSLPYSCPGGNSRCSSSEQQNNMRWELMINWLHEKQQKRAWTTGERGEGIVLKKSKGNFVCCPDGLLNEDSNFYSMITLFNVRAAMTVNTAIIRLLLERNDTPYLEIREGHRLQVIPTMTDLPYCQKHQSAAFVADQKLLVVWEHEPKKLLDRAQYIQDSLMAVVWGQESTISEKVDETKPAIGQVRPSNTDAEATAENPRRIVLHQTISVAITLALVISAIGSGWKLIAVEIMVDQNWIRMIFLLCIIPQLWLALFFFQAFIGNMAQLFGPIDQMKQNTKYYSGLPPRKLSPDHSGGLPHVTVQMPVYKEGLHSVTEPTIFSIKNAISTYELQGGTANIFVNDDGMQLIEQDQAQERRDFYDEHNIGWVARPGHNPKPTDDSKPFIRGGKFKKASNMNYALWASVQLEEKLTNRAAAAEYDQKFEDQLYAISLKELLHENSGQLWADGNIRVGDYILLIDCDTRVPQDCLLEAVSEMEQSPEVAVMQFSSGVMNVTESFFERGITFFTNLVYTQIRYAVASGDVAPFVGHNAMIRWSAIQDIAYDCAIDNREKYWSESTVSEDFDMALRLQTHGYIVRLAAYKGDGFKEGVSLTVYDELARWEKYAYGCNELIFHPLKYWLTRGPFTSLFKGFMMSAMPLPSKITIMAYIGTYYALGSAWLLTLANYFLVGWYNGYLDSYYIDSFKVYFAIIMVFTGLGNLSLAVLRYRTNEKGLIASLWENLSWIPLLVIFLGGISIHISQALAAHMLGFDMEWGSTSKEFKHVGFFDEISRVFRKFWPTFLFCTVVGVGMAVLATAVPQFWEIRFFTPIWPLACSVVFHILLPIALNPGLMLFSW